VFQAYSVIILPL